MSSPILTICVTTYNRWDKLDRTLKSITSQYKNDIEIILVDDCSKEKMPQNITQLVEDNSVLYIRHHQNMGLPAARNSALKVAKGKYFSFCDDDDVWDRDAISNLTRVLSSEKPDMLISQPLFLGSKNKEIQKLNLKSIFLEGITPPVGSQVFLLELIRSVGGYREKIRSGVDHDLWINLLKKNVDNVLIVNFPIAFLSMNFDETRLTLNVRKRTEGISSSLDIWKPEIETTFGSSFFNHFRKDYYKHILRKFIIYEIKGKQYISIFRFLRNEFFFHVLKDLFLEKTKIRKRRTSFRPFNR